MQLDKFIPMSCWCDCGRKNMCLLLLLLTHSHAAFQFFFPSELKNFSHEYSMFALLNGWGILLLYPRCVSGHLGSISPHQLAQLNEMCMLPPMERWAAQDVIHMAKPNTHSLCTMALYSGYSDSGDAVLYYRDKISWKQYLGVRIPP